LELNSWVTEQHLPRGDMSYEVTEPETGSVIAVLDLAWPEGIQTGYSESVAVLLNEDLETLELASASGYRCFTDVVAFRTYVEKEVLAAFPA